MKRLWPRTLSGQLILVMLLAVALTQAVTLVIYRFERAHALRKILGEECVGRAASACRLVQEIAPPARTETLDTIETPLTRYWISANRADPIEWQHDARRRLLEGITPSGGNSQGASLFLMESMLNEVSNVPWTELTTHSLPIPRPMQILDLSRWNGFGFAVHLDDGTWLNMIYAKPSFLTQPTLTPGYYTALVITFLIFAGVALFVARRISRPLRHLAKSAERLGRGEELEVLPEEGSADIRSTIAAFNRMQIRLRRFLEDRTHLLAAIGHDLRTPITSLRLRTEFIADEDTRAKFNATLDEMQGMAEAALSFAKTESLTEPTRTVELNALLESICDDLADMGWDVKFTSDGRLPYPCRPAALRRAIRNVIENAIRYGNHARVALHKTDEGVDICVEDDGPGIPPDEYERVFQPFVRLEASRNRDTGGVGLGLAIARSIVRNHGGDVEFSRRDTGFCTHLRLPDAPAESSAKH